MNPYKIIPSSSLPQKKRSAKVSENLLGKSCLVRYSSRMNTPHPLGVVATSQAALEAVDPKFIEAGLIRARDQTKLALETICASLKEGMTEEVADKMVLEIFAGLGVKKHWHRPHVRFGPGTLLTFNDPSQKTHPLMPGDLYYVDLGPVWADTELGLEYEGDYGDSFVWGDPAKNPAAVRCAKTCRALFLEARAAWKSKQLTGQGIYAHLKNRAEAEGYHLVEEVGGHRVADFPHHRYSKSDLAHVGFIPSNSLWILEVQISDLKNGFGAFFEDIL
jgi:hypothetical protein